MLELRIIAAGTQMPLYDLPAALGRVVRPGRSATPSKA
jgi:hypothetical protein